MIKYFNLILLLSIVVLSACSKKEKETPSGLKFTILKEGDTTYARKDQIIVFDYLMKDSKDSIWASTFNEGVPAANMVGDSSRISQEDGMTQMFRMLHVNDSVKTSMTVPEFFKTLVHAPLPPKLDTTLVITYIVKVREVTTIEKYYKAREIQITARDTKNINKYAADNKLTTQSDTSGLQYILHSNLGGPKPTVESCVQVKYKGKFLKDGRVFDESPNISFPLNGVIAGWKLGIPLLGIGDSATLFIPSKLAYGPQGYPGAIPPDAILIFDVKLLDIKKEFDPQTRTCK
jgi:FKBP-type peptidyl-prolyl cis-trans isomerase FkpA